MNATTTTHSATAVIPARRYAVGQTVALYRRTQLSPNAGVAEDWYIADATQALDGPMQPAWGDPAGYTVQWTGWGVGIVHAVREQGDLVKYEVAEAEV